MEDNSAKRARKSRGKDKKKSTQTALPTYFSQPQKSSQGTEKRQNEVEHSNLKSMDIKADSNLWQNNGREFVGLPNILKHSMAENQSFGDKLVDELIVIYDRNDQKTVSHQVDAFGVDKSI